MALPYPSTSKRATTPQDIRAAARREIGSPLDSSGGLPVLPASRYAGDATGGLGMTDDGATSPTRKQLPAMAATKTRPPDRPVPNLEVSPGGDRGVGSRPVSGGRHGVSMNYNRSRVSSGDDSEEATSPSGPKRAPSAFGPGGLTGIEERGPIVVAEPVAAVGRPRTGQRAPSAGPPGAGGGDNPFANRNPFGGGRTRAVVPEEARVEYQRLAPQVRRPSIDPPEHDGGGKRGGEPVISPQRSSQSTNRSGVSHDDEAPLSGDSKFQEFRTAREDVPLEPRRGEHAGYGAHKPDEAFAMSPAQIAAVAHGAAAHPGSLANTGRNILTSTLSSVPMIWKRGDMLGQGSFGRVYKGLNIQTGELFAVKQITADRAEDADPGALEALAKELDVMRSLKHENIVRYFGTQRDDAFLWVFLELVPGGSMARLIKEFGVLDENMIALYIRQVLQGLVYLHENNIIHRDIKAANILINEMGVVKLADFGCSKRLEGETGTKKLDASLRAIRGTVPFMAPEVIRQTGHGRKADIWSLGATIIELATGSPPWSEFSTNLATMFHVGTSGKVPEFPPHLSPMAHDFLDKCFRTNPEDRWSATALLTHDFVKNAVMPKGVSPYFRTGLSRS